MKRIEVLRYGGSRVALWSGALRIGIALLASAAAPLASPATASASRVQDTLDLPRIGIAVDSLVRSRMAEHGVAGAAVAVMKEGRLLKSTGYGTANLETGEAVAPGTAFFIASITKAFTAAAVLRLVDDGALDLDAPIGTLLPELPEAWQAATLRDLLAMTSGIPGSMQSPGVPWPDYRTTLDSAAARPPGRRGVRQYGGIDYELLGKVVEAVTGKPFADHVHDSLFERFGLRSATFGDWREIRPGRAEWYSTYDVQRQDFSAGRHVLRTDYPAYRWPAAGIFISAEDLASFADALGDGRVLGPAGMESYWRPVALADGRRTGDLLGSWGTVEDADHIAWHEGGVRAAVYHDRRERLTIVLLTNVQGGVPLRWIGGIHSLYAGKQQ